MVLCWTNRLTIAVCMLQALPYAEREFYRSEARVVDSAGKSRVIAAELEQQFAFVASEEREYVSYLHREEVRRLWSWSLASDIRSFVDFAAVLKKDCVTQRKILMANVTNYWWSDVRPRADHGLYGGGALAQTHVL